MSALGLRFGGETVTAVRLADNGRWEAQTVALDELASLAEWVEAAGSRVGATFAVPLVHRRLRFPFTQARKIQQVLPLNLEEHLSGANEAFERHVVIGADAESGRADVTLMTRDDAAAARANIAPLGDAVRTLEPEALRMAAVHGATPPGAYVWLEPRQTTVVVRTDDGPPAAFSVPIGLDHLDDPYAGTNWRNRLLSGMDEPVARWTLDGWGRGAGTVAAALAPLGDHINWAWHVPGDDDPDDPAARSALAAAQAALDRERPLWNLAPRRPLLDVEVLKHPALRALLAPAALVVLMTLVAFASGTAMRHAEADAYRREVGQIYQRNFPSSRVVDPIRQMKGVLGRSDDGGAAPGAAGPVVQRLAEFHAATSRDTQLNVTELRTAAGDWLLKGEAPDFGAVDQLKQTVEGLDWTHDVRVQRAEQTIDKSAIRFQIGWSEGAP